MDVKGRLLRLADADYRAFHLRLIPGVSPESVLGVRVPAIRALAKSMTEEERLAFLGELPAPCRLCGYWKVYFDEENARRVFALYDRCRAVYREAYRSGRSVPELMELPVSG